MNLINNDPAFPSKHQWYDLLVDEIHSRSFPFIQGSVTLSQVTLLHGKSSKSDQIEHLNWLAERYRLGKVDPDSSCYYHDLGELDIRWEYHTEFSTYCFIRLNQGEKPFTRLAWSLLPKTWCTNIPGLLISASHIDIQLTLPDTTCLLQVFSAKNIASSLVMEGKAQLLASFKPVSDGFDRILIIDYGITQTQAGRLLRCLLELSSYRIMVLLSLPVSKKTIAYYCYNGKTVS